MFKYFNQKRRKGQSTLEYAILIIIILGALLSIQVYIKRGIQGRMKQAADDIGDQHSPGNQNIVHIMKTDSKTQESFLKGETKSLLLTDEKTYELMNSFVINVEQEFWGK